MADRDESENKIDNLEREIKALSAFELDLLLKRLGVLKLGTSLGAEVRIDDYLGLDKQRPRATIHHIDGIEESIDIIKTVEANATSIGHPLVLHAIRRWENIIKYHHSFSGTKYDPSKNFYKLAQSHLTRLGKALLDGAKERSLPNESVADVVRALSSNLEYRYLRSVWEMFAQSDFKRLNRHTSRLKLIEEKLREAADSEVLPLLKPIIPIPLCEALIAKAKYLLPKIALQIVALEVRQSIIAVTCVGDGIHLKTDKGNIIRYSLGSVIKQSGLFSVRERKLLAAVYGLIECAADIPGVELLKRSKLDIIIDFLNSNEGNYLLNSRRKSWLAFRSSFDSWRFGLNKRTMRTYRHRAKKSSVAYGSIDGRFLIPDWLNEYRFPEIGDWLSFPTVTSNKP